MQVLELNNPTSASFIDDSENEMATAQELTITVARLEERVRNHIRFFWAVVAFGIGWLGLLTWQIIGIRTDQHQILTNVGQIREQQTLLAITNQAQVVEVKGKVPDQQTTHELKVASSTVMSAITNNPTNAGTWRAASSLVNVRSVTQTPIPIPADIEKMIGPAIANQGDCFKVPMPPSHFPPMGPEQNNSAWEVTDTVHDCTLYLDDTAGFYGSTFAKYIWEHIRTAQNVYVTVDFILVRVIIVYRGGPVIPVGKITFYNCMFDFNVPSAPSEQGRDLLRAFVSSDLQGNMINVKPAVIFTHS